MNNSENGSREVAELSRLIMYAETDENFADFIIYCSARLNKGAPVQSIWNDYLRIIQKTPK